MIGKVSRVAIVIALFVLVGSLPAFAVPVNAPFGSDTFAKAIHFQGVTKPIIGSNGAVGNILRGGGGGYTGVDSGIIMSPVGDGSYVCTAAVYPGQSYQYYFSFRNRTYEPDTTASWLTTAPGNERDQDRNRARSVLIPTTATDGYILYHVYGDSSVIGYQGPDTEVLTTENPYLANYGGWVTMAGLNVPADTFARVSNGSPDTYFGNMDGTNAYGFDVLQTGDSSFQLSWTFNIGGAEIFVPSVMGANTYIGTQTLKGSPQYGFRIWRSDSPAQAGFSGLAFNDITTLVTNGGDTNYADDDNNSFNVTNCIDTSMPDTVSTFYYCVTWYNAYQYLNNDTTRQDFSGGNDSITRGPAIRVFFIVEHFNDEVVFPDGRTTGRVYLTPYIDGVRRPDLRMPATAVKIKRNIG